MRGLLCAFICSQLRVIPLALRGAGEHIQGGGDAAHSVPRTHSVNAHLVRMAREQLRALCLQDGRLVCMRPERNP